MARSGESGAGAGRPPEGNSFVGDEGESSPDSFNLAPAISLRASSRNLACRSSHVQQTRTDRLDLQLVSGEVRPQLIKVRHDGQLIRHGEQIHIARLNHPRRSCPGVLSLSVPSGFSSSPPANSGTGRIGGTNEMSDFSSASCRSDSIMLLTRFSGFRSDRLLLNALPSRGDAFGGGSGEDGFASSSTATAGGVGSGVGTREGTPLIGVSSSELFRLVVSCSSWFVSSDMFSEKSIEFSRSGMSSRSSSGAMSDTLFTDISEMMLCMSSSVALPSRRNTQLSVSSRLAARIFFDTGRNRSVNVCCVDSILAYLRMLIVADARARFLPSCDTSSSTNVQSLSSSSCVRMSLNSVTAIVWLSGIGQDMVLLSGLIRSGCHSSALDWTRRERRVHTTCMKL
uniref:Uncharacterized protein n=1 Tax=Anopheles merus TaxID=30066 RepID=A0A182VL41_ANOME